mmetsp:Transcript_5669/g.8360  ORF Transcript_5669/g.8360 Transcript_5669/m.8360 type:complete len:301 (+) Transcript_5669:49-951(+)
MSDFAKHSIIDSKNGNPERYKRASALSYIFSIHAKTEGKEFTPEGEIHNYCYRPDCLPCEHKFKKEFSMTSRKYKSDESNPNVKKKNIRRSWSIETESVRKHLKKEGCTCWPAYEKIAKNFIVKYDLARNEKLLCKKFAKAGIKYEQATINALKVHVQTICRDKQLFPEECKTSAMTKKTPASPYPPVNSVCLGHLASLGATYLTPEKPKKKRKASSLVEGKTKILASSPKKIKRNQSPEPWLELQSRNSKNESTLTPEEGTNRLFIGPHCTCYDIQLPNSFATPQKMSPFGVPLLPDLY